MITSTANKRVRRLSQLVKKAKFRKEENVFITEGYRIFRETPKELIQEVYVTDRFREAHAEELSDNELRRASQYCLSEEVFSRVADTKTPQGILCVVKRLQKNTEELLRENGLWLLLEDIQDPGNLGTIVRTAEGAGVSGIFLSPGCVDIFSPKVVRSTMGSIFRVPFAGDCDLAEVVSLLKENAVTVYAAGLNHACCYDEPDYCAGSAFLIGNEGNGLSVQMLNAADRIVRIPMQGQLESLNAAMAAGILIYEAARQRRK